MLKQQSVIKQICKSSILVALSTIFGFFAHFQLFQGHVFLVGAIIFLFPLFLKWPFALISTIISISLVDIFSGWSQYFWISTIAYCLSIIVIIVFHAFKFKLFYLIGVLLACFLNVAIYFVLDNLVFGKDIAFYNVIPNIIQFSIIFAFLCFAYFPTKILTKII